MGLFTEDEIIKLILDTLEKHDEVDLKIVAHVFVQHKIIRELIEEKNYRDEDAIMEGKRIQLEIEKILVSYSLELEKQGKFNHNTNTMKILHA